eukprot:TRINITY_DN7709_c0_g1_i3.p1 TRINITY_DN7709_c0_g1~~TRINITY_DN7709_c0_g1_i3.p1  ORF type:complete len:438 (+),score=95.69 TRINITY_DN7709_c0_g1_i3:109-1422(+)
MEALAPKSSSNPRGLKAEGARKAKKLNPVQLALHEQLYQKTLASGLAPTDVEFQALSEACGGRELATIKWWFNNRRYRPVKIKGTKASTGVDAVERTREERERYNQARQADKDRRKYETETKVVEPDEEYSPRKKKQRRLDALAEDAGHWRVRTLTKDQEAILDGIFHAEVVGNFPTTPDQMIVASQHLSLEVPFVEGWLIRRRSEHARLSAQREKLRMLQTLKVENVPIDFDVMHWAKCNFGDLDLPLSAVIFLLGFREALQKRQLQHSASALVPLLESSESLEESEVSVSEFQSEMSNSSEEGVTGTGVTATPLGSPTCAGGPAFPSFAVQAQGAPRLRRAVTPMLSRDSVYSLSDARHIDPRPDPDPTLPSDASSFAASAADCLEDLPDFSGLMYDFIAPADLPADLPVFGANDMNFSFAVASFEISELPVGFV